MYNDLNEELKKAIDQAIERADSLPAGSEERAREFKNIKICLDYMVDKFKFDEDSLDQRAKLEKEIELKEEEIKNEKNKYKHKIVELMLLIISVVGTAVFGAVMEVKGWRPPRALDLSGILGRLIKL